MVQVSILHAFVRLKSIFAVRKAQDSVFDVTLLPILNHHQNQMANMTLEYNLRGICHSFASKNEDESANK